MKKIDLKKLARAAGRYSLYIIRTIVKYTPYIIFRLLTLMFFYVGYCVMFKKRKLAKENLKVAFGNEKTDKELKQIASKCFSNFGKGMIDLIYFLDRPKAVDKNVRIVGKENLDDVLKQGKGAVMVSAHFGNFILMYIKLVQAGYKTNVIMRRTRDENFEKYISEFRDEKGIKTIYDLPPRRCVQQSLKCLRGNEILMILLDQNYGSDGRIFVDFFGRQAATATGPVVFAGRTGASILPVFTMRDEGYNCHKIIIEKPMEFESSEDDKVNIVANVAKLTKIIERYVRLFPHEWGGWMHKRWKSRTRDEQEIIDQQNGV